MGGRIRSAGPGIASETEVLGSVSATVAWTYGDGYDVAASASSMRLLKPAEARILVAAEVFDQRAVARHGFDALPAFNVPVSTRTGSASGQGTGHRQGVSGKHG